MLGLRLDRAASIRLAYPISRLWNKHLGTRIPILMYHGIRDGLGTKHPYYETNTSPEIFAGHMKFLYEQGYETITLSDAVNRLPEPGINNRRNVVITVDDGYRDFYTDAFPILGQYGFTATLFLVTGGIGNRRSNLFGAQCLIWSEVRELHSNGVEIGSHTVSHPVLELLDAGQIEYEVRCSKETIEDMIGDAVKSFSYPFAFPEADKKFTCSLADALARHGYQNGVSTVIGTAGSRDNRFFLPRLPMNSLDDLVFFRVKLEGGYDWLHKPQYLVKIIKGFHQNQDVDRIACNALDR